VKSKHKRSAKSAPVKYGTSFKKLPSERRKRKMNLETYEKLKLPQNFEVKISKSNIEGQVAALLYMSGFPDNKDIDSLKFDMNEGDLITVSGQLKERTVNAKPDGKGEGL
jgi:hypothetical protein